MRVFVLPIVACAAAGVDRNTAIREVARWFKIDQNSPEMKAARKEEVSFLEQTIHSMEYNKQAVIKSNEELDKQVKESERRLRHITAEVTRETERTKERMMQLQPFSLLEVKRDMGDDEVSMSHPSVLEVARARASESEKRFQAAMKKLEADRQALLKDESMRRARAQQERRHVQ